MAVNISERVEKAAAKDIRELESKIESFINDEIPEDKFKAYRLTRGVYGQRQAGVQMFRTKLPYGKITVEQLYGLADASEKYATGNLHLTTRQNIQLHYVKLTDSPKVWATLADVGVTAREACGNTVRNITASANAGVDPEEPFDVSPYAHGMFEYFLRYPVCQDMGRKIKIAFSSSERDSAFTYFHDWGFIPKMQDGKIGFKVVVGGGLGGQTIIAATAYEFLEADKIIPFVEAGLRVFDRYGERAKRHKARMKFLIKEVGFEEWMKLVEAEQKSLKYKSYPIDGTFNAGTPVPEKDRGEAFITDTKKYEQWLQTNVFEQKQKGFYGVNIKILKGDIDHKQARIFGPIVKEFAADDIRVTVNQGLLLRFVRKNDLPHLFNALNEIGYAEPGFDSILDITVCPGTDTCALGVTNSMGLAKVLEDVLKEEYEGLINDPNIKIKMSGCMNSCGQHMAAQIGLHGSSIKVDDLVAPAMQIILGGGVDPDGVGYIGDKIIKLPTKRIPDCLRIILNDYDEKAVEGEYFNQYYRRLGKKHFYDILKGLGEKSSFQPNEFIDWGETENFIPDVGVGECAGVSYDMVSSILKDADIKYKEAMSYLIEQKNTEAIYEAYTGFIISAKALLLGIDVACNTHIKIIEDFDTHFASKESFNSLNGKSFIEVVLQIQENEPSTPFAEQYVSQLERFLDDVKSYKNKSAKDIEDKKVIDNYYKA